ncbi:MAG TPA: DUF475 domain-containing protein, partial [Pseudobdellovibrionaceae bacterium]|nr:DUF475 domain-containing protein [Pseudobdellovibrionaceae bacterium]
MKLIFKYFSFSLFFFFASMVFLFFADYALEKSFSMALNAVFIAFVLAILEISLSFDNAIVNALVLKKMTPQWQHRFLTWGMVIAVFGMRLFFPLAIVAIVGKMSPWSALILALKNPAEYSRMMLQSHIEISAFGGAFLLMVALKFFYDEHKDVHWLKWFEKPFSRLGKVEAIEIAMGLFILLVMSSFLMVEQQVPFLKSGLIGILLFIVIDGVGAYLEASQQTMKDIHKAQFSMFLYLELLDASFSFDGVIGAFAITQNLVTIMVGLSIGAFFVRSLTLYFVGEKTLQKFIFLEHGAFYAIGFLALFMLGGVFIHIPEWVTG